jgi:hypothetical protein
VLLRFAGCGDLGHLVVETATLNRIATLGAALA